MTMRIAKANLTTRVAMVLAGTKKHLSNGSELLTLEGGAESLTVDAISQQLQTLLSNRAAVVAAQATARAKLDAETAQLPALNALFDAFVAVIRFRFGADATAMADFGVAPHKAPAPLTAEQKAVAAAKRKATRAARGTSSAKQKKAIKGHVTATLVVTPEAPAAAPPAAPVAAAGPVKA